MSSSKQLISIIIAACFHLTLCTPPTLRTMPLIVINDGDSIDISVEHCPFILEDEDLAETIFTISKGYCYCYLGECTIPGPTFEIYNGSNIHVTVHNNLGGQVTPSSAENGYKDIDITNIHTHGLHIDPHIDNVMDVVIGINESWTYNYSVPSDHYPGTHWFHAHHHGSTSWQNRNGLLGTLIVRYDPISEPLILDEDLLNMKENILLFHFSYPIAPDDCNCAVQENGLFDINSYCWEWCQFPESEQQATDYVYDIDIPDKDKYQRKKIAIINGQYRPRIDDLIVGRWRRLRIINGMGFDYLQFKMPTAHCEWYLLALDGIFLDDAPKDLSQSPKNGELIISSGGRADIAVRCDVDGIYKVNASTKNHDDRMFALPRLDDGDVLFSFRVNNVTSPNISLSNDNVTELPLSYPVKPHYLTNLQEWIANDANLSSTDKCECNTFPTSFFNIFAEPDDCRWFFGENIFDFTQFGINSVRFNHRWPLTYVRYGEIYKFHIRTQAAGIAGLLGAHVYHQHVNPYQIIEDVAGGFMAEEGQRFDTFGAPHSFDTLTYPIDFYGKYMIHCHMLDHEDEGMMGYYNVRDNVNYTINDQCSSLEREITPEDIVIIIVIVIGSVLGCMCITGLILYGVRKKLTCDFCYIYNKPSGGDKNENETQMAEQIDDNKEKENNPVDDGPTADTANTNNNENEAGDEQDKENKDTVTENKKNDDDWSKSYDLKFSDNENEAKQETQQQNEENEQDE